MRRLARLLDATLLLMAAACLVLAGLLRLLPLTGHELVVIAGGSMEPAIPLGSLVVLERVEPATIAAGDVVSVRSAVGRTVVTHRVVRAVERDGNPWLELRGDANEGPDPTLVPASAVLGRVVHVLPGLGRPVTIAATPSGLLVVVGLAGLLLGLAMAARLVATPVVRPLGRPA